MSIGERFIKLSSRLPYTEEIPLGVDVTINVGGHLYIANCVKREEFDKQDGSIDVVHVLKWAGE